MNQSRKGSLQPGKRLKKPCSSSKRAKGDLATRDAATHSAVTGAAAGVDVTGAEADVARAAAASVGARTTVSVAMAGTDVAGVAVTRATATSVGARISAWLQNSIDPIDGNDKELEQYWGDVTVAYNSTTKSNRKRNRNQLKLCWERIKKPVTDFNGCWSMMERHSQCSIYGEYYDMKKKWSAYVKKQNNEKGKSATVNNPVHVVNVEDIVGQRPIGQKKAKDEHKGKRKASLPLSEMNEELDKFVEASTMVRKEREKMSEVQQNLANKKVYN
uniref:No apical meristem-associated C-terminal domain-containing protein n=1 Tax=Oryza brachyantha TaxID=4533 RepID=J3L1E7_ORYBR